MYRVFKTLVRRFHSQTNPQKYGTIGIAMPNGENNKTVWNYPMVKSFASDGHIWSYCACWWNLNIQNPHCRLFCVWNFPCLLLKSPCVLVRLARSTVVSSWSLYFFCNNFQDLFLIAPPISPISPLRIGSHPRALDGRKKWWKVRPCSGLSQTKHRLLR